MMAAAVPRSPLTVSPMTPAAIDDVLAIETRVYPRPWNESLFLSEMAQQSSRVYLVARIDDRVVGYGGVMLVPSEAHVTTIAVDPDHHRERIGTAMLIALVRGALDRGAASLTLEVRSSNTAARELYRGFGFAPVGLRPGYYRESNEDAIVMWVHDVDGSDYADLLDRREADLPRVLVIEEGES